MGRPAEIGEGSTKTVVHRLRFTAQAPCALQPVLPCWTRPASIANRPIAARQTDASPLRHSRPVVSPLALRALRRRAPREQQGIPLSMAGQPRKRAMREELERRTREFFDGEEGRTPLDYAECLIASGTSIRKLAEALTKTLGFEVNRETLRRHLQSLDEEHYADRMRTAQEHGAHAFAESSIDILDEASPEEASLAAARSRARQWISEKWNAREFGRAQGPSVVLNVGQLMLQALQQPAPLAAPALTPLPSAPADVVSIEPAD